MKGSPLRGENAQVQITEEVDPKAKRQQQGRGDRQADGPVRVCSKG
jgi:hypothetical protein